MKMKKILNEKNEKALQMLISVGIFVLLFLLILGTISFTFEVIDKFTRPKSLPTDMSFMLIPYHGIPFVFWLFAGVGLMIGLPSHGFRLITSYKEVKK